MQSESPLGEQAVEALRRAFQETNATERLVLLDEALRLHRLARAEAYAGLSESVVLSDAGPAGCSSDAEEPPSEAAE